MKDHYKVYNVDQILEEIQIISKLHMEMADIVGSFPDVEQFDPLRNVWNELNFHMIRLEDLSTED